MKITGIYKITNPSGAVYVGQSRNITKRRQQYKGLYCHKQTYLYRSIKKYGWDNHDFKLIEHLPNDLTQEDLNRREIFHWSMEVNQGKEMLNMKPPGSNGSMTESAKEKIRISATGRKMTEETKEKLRKALTGRVFSEEWKNKISISNKGKEYNKSWLGKKHTNDQKEKIRNANLGRSFSDSHRKNLSLSHKGLRNLAIYQYDLLGNLIKKWDSIKEAGDMLGISRGNISLCLSGKLTRTKKFKWRLAA